MNQMVFTVIDDGHDFLAVRGSKAAIYVFYIIVFEVRNDFGRLPQIPACIRIVRRVSICKIANDIEAGGRVIGQFVIKLYHILSVSYQNHRAGVTALTSV